MNGYKKDLIDAIPHDKKSLVLQLENNQQFEPKILNKLKYKNIK